LFETVTSIAEQVDPIKLNQTLAATAEALTGLGGRFGQSLENGNQILDNLNPQMSQIARDNRGLADLAEVYADASPDLWQGLENAVETAQTFDDYRANIDEALMAAVGFANDTADSFERGGPYLVRGAADLAPTTQLLDDYRGTIFCTFRKFSDVQKRASAALGGNGYSLASASGALAGAGNPYVYPDNLPRVNAHGGPEGRPGCWQDVNRYLWPAPYLVMDTGASIAPYNHIELGQPLFIDYVWGRQVGEYTINPSRLTSIVVEVLRSSHDLQNTRTRLSAPGRAGPVGHHPARRHAAEQPGGIRLQRGAGHHRHRRLPDVEEPEVPQHRAEQQGGVCCRRHHLT